LTIGTIDNHKENTTNQTFPRNNYSATTLLAGHTPKHIAVADQCRSKSTHRYASHENVNFFNQLLFYTYIIIYLFIL
jgi:hypothetical protein